MHNFYDLYTSFDDFYDTLMRGNEIEFIYDNDRYFILPIFKDENVVGVYFGKEYCDPIPEYLSKNELLYAKIGNCSLGDILKKIQIKWYNF